MSSLEYPNYSAYFDYLGELVVIKFDIFCKVSSYEEPHINVVDVNDVLMCDYAAMFEELHDVKSSLR